MAGLSVFNLDKVTMSLPSVLDSWAALVSAAPCYQCYDTDAACGKLKVSLTAFLPLPSPRTSNMHDREQLQREQGCDWWARRIKDKKMQHIYNS